ncbi:glycoside hydrolase family 16 protein [Paraconexibacter antarcticus]|uniref:Glycoside hydrolase family 16 protein n=1 Tax=Paraconexibacter antarcticus TaxID=2949664 RepID=A0ABY5DXM4_9ACTN|nr:glycoside hydrolase family 16 protein [Paraconexibacter antarcticus]UTI66786.1 glycoside hydrolase family 16 protein [Paraconexibacter antarcticus]
MNFSLRRSALCLLLAAGVATAGAPSSAQAAGKPTKPSAPTCGTTIYKSSGSAWTCTFDDEFGGTSLDGSKWIAQETANSGYTSGLTACFVNSPNNISVAGGTLNLTARKEAAPFTCTDPYGNFTTQYTSGMVSTYGRFGQAYGRFEVRAKLPAATVAGLQESMWLWPVDPYKYGAWPGSGEIDIAEAYSQYPDRAIPYIHYNAAAFDPNVTNTSCLISNLAAFHTYAVEWTTSTLKIIYDGQTCLIDDWNPASPLIKPQPFDQPFIIALTQALGIGTNAFDPATTPLPATTSIDYVRVWE